MIIHNSVAIEIALSVLLHGWGILCAAPRKGNMPLRQCMGARRVGEGTSLLDSAKKALTVQYS